MVVGAKSGVKTATRGARAVPRTVVTSGAAVALVIGAQSAVYAACSFGNPPPGPLGAQSTVFATRTVNSIGAAIGTANTAFQTQTSAFLASPPGSKPNEFASGFWVRGVGGETTIDSKANGIFGFTGGSLNCKDSSRNEYWGTQAGFDFGTLAVGNTGWNVHGGATFGYLEVDSFASTNKVNTQVPFVGLYAALTNGGFYIDAQLRRDFYRMDISSPDVSVFGAKLNARGWSFSSSAGYNYAVGSYFIEPSVAISYSRTGIDTLAAVTTVGPNSNLKLIDVDDVESVLGRAGVRVGTSFIAGGMSLQPFAAASVWNEFAGSTGASVLNTQNNSRSTFNSSRVGTFGQYSIGISGGVIDTGWLGYVRADYRNGANIEGWSVNGGLRYQFAPAAARASR